MADKEVKIKVTTEADMSNLEDLKDNIEEITSKSEELGSNLSENLNETTEATETVTESMEELNESINSIDGESLENTSNSAEELTESTSSASESTSELADNLDNIDGSTLSDAATDADTLADSASSANESISELGDSLGLIESASLMSIGEGLSGYADSAEGFAQEINTAAISVGQLATNVGMAEPQMVSLINHISNATFPQEEAMAYVQALNQMGVSASNLGDAATNMDKINDATGVGYQTVMQLTQGLRAVGIEADNLPASFNAIAYAQANVNGGTDTLNKVLMRQASTIQEYGLNVDQLVIIMQKLSEKGVSARKMGSELSTVLKECNGDTTALEQSLGLTAGTLSNASSVTGQYEGQLQSLADEEAEHKTLLDQVNAAWEDVVLSLNGVLGPLSGVTGAFGALWGNMVQINSLVQLVQVMREWSVVTKMVEAAQWLLNASLWANPITWVVVAVVALIAILWYLYDTNEDVRNAIDAFADTLLNLPSIIYDNVVGAFEYLQGAWENTVQFFEDYGQLFLEAFFVVSTGGIGAIALLIGNMNGMPSKIGGILQNAINYVVRFGTNLVNNFVNGARNSVTNFINEISKAPQEFVDELNKMIDDAIDFATNLPQILWDAGANAVSNFLSGLGRHSPGTMQREMVAELTEIADLIPGLIDAIGNNLTLIGGKADEFVGQITDKMSTGMSSTDAILSTGMEWIMNGVAQLLNTMGLNGDAFVQTWWNMGTNTIQAVNNLIANISSLPSRISSYLSSVIGNVSSFASNFVSRLGSAATNAVSRFTNGIKNLSKGLVDELNEMLSQALNFAGKLGSALYNLGVNAVKNFLSGIGRNSPGIIQNEMLAELSETATRVPESQGLMVRNISKYADSIVTAWGKPTFKYDFELGNIDNNVDISQSNLSDALNNILNLLNSRSNNGNTFNFTLNGDMDNEERMQKFIDAIIKEINWHNETAGRTAGTITL